MEKLIFVLVISFGSIFLGYLCKFGLEYKKICTSEQLKEFSSKLKVFTIAGLVPIPIINSFWNFSLNSVSLLVFPLLGILFFGVSGLGSLLFNKICKIPPYRAASIVSSAMVTNLGIFGGLIGFVLFGSIGYLLVQLFTIFEFFIYYGITFPLSNLVSKGALHTFRFKISLLLEKPVSFIPILSILLGILLNIFKAPYPLFMGNLSAIIIPLMTGVFAFSLGLTLRINTIKDYQKEIGIIMVIKFILAPSVVILGGYLAGLNQVLNGIPLKMLVILSLMPVGFIALVPPAIYGFDLDLANSAWLMTTLVSLLVFFPVLYFILV